jgi:hypothetical protein
MIVKFGQSGTVGVNKDLSQPELPNSAWTDANNIRFLDGYAGQVYGYGEIYATPAVVPYHVLPVQVNGTRYWIYAGSGKIYAVNGTTHTNLTRASGGDYTGTRNNWTSTTLSGIPVLNDGVNAPQYWDLNIANKFTALTAWPASTSCASIKAYKNYLVALDVTKSGTRYPFMVKWSSPADAGAVPASWDHTSTIQDAGETDLAVGGDYVVDGAVLRNDFIIYKQSSMWRMTFTGGPYVFSFAPISNTNGILAKNCVQEMDGWHFVVTGSDIIIHDGQNITSVLDKQTRRFFFTDMDADYYGRTYVFKNDFMSEICVAYPSAGNSVCNKILCYNFKDKTVSFRSAPSLNHAASGLLESNQNNLWSSDSAPWGSDTTGWNRPDFTPDSVRCVWASDNQKLYLMDSSTTFDGALPESYLERIGLTFDAPESIKLVRGIRPRITGTAGETVTISVGYSNDPYSTPTYTNMTHVIGSTVANDCLVSGRYIAIKFGSSNTYQWRLDSFDVDVVTGGIW